MYILEEKERNDRLKRNWLIVLVLAFLLSHTFLFRFDITNGFKFTGVWTHFLTPILGFGQQFESIIVTSAIIGYILFLLFFIFNYKKAKQKKSRFIEVGIVTSTIAILHELYIYERAYLECFTPYPFFTGIPLLIISAEVCRVLYFDKE